MYIDNLNNLEILGWLIQTSTRERLHLTKYISGKCPECQHRGHIHRLQQVVASWSRGAFAPRPCWQQCHDWPTPRGARLRHVLSAVGFVSQLQMPSECISQGLFCGMKCKHSAGTLIQDGIKPSKFYKLRTCGTGIGMVSQMDCAPQRCQFQAKNWPHLFVFFFDARVFPHKLAGWWF